MDDWRIPYVEALDALYPEVPGAREFVTGAVEAGEHAVAVLDTLGIAEDRGLALSPAARAAVEELHRADPNADTADALALATALAA